MFSFMTAAPEDADADSAGDHHVLNDIKAGLDLHSTYRYISLSIYIYIYYRITLFYQL